MQPFIKHYNLFLNVVGYPQLIQNLCNAQSTNILLACSEKRRKQCSDHEKVRLKNKTKQNKN